MPATWEESPYESPYPAPSAAGTSPRWRVVDIVTAAMLGVAVGVLFWAWDAVFAALTPVFTAAAALSGLAVGVWLVGGVLGGFVIRRPGAALAVEVLAAFVSMLLGNQWGATTIVSGVAQGLGVELVLLLTGYRAWTAAVALAAGAMAAVFEVAGYEWWSYWAGYSWGFRITYLVACAVSGAVLAGGGGYALVRALARTGALRRMPSGGHLPPASRA